MITLDESEIDERLGLPSISAFEQLALCPGSYAAQQGLPELGDTTIRQEGVNIHAVLSGELPESILPPNLRWILDRTAEQEEALIDTVFPNYERSELEQLSETRYWFEDESGTKIYSGKLDRVYLDPEHTKAVVIDYKFGFKRVMSADSNRQIRGGVVLLAKNYFIPHVMGAIIQPRIAGSEALLITEYKGEQIKKASKKNLTLVARALQDNAPRNPGVTQCEYCRAKTTCREAIDFYTSKGQEIIGSLQLPVIDAKPKQVKECYKVLPVEKRRAIAEIYPIMKSLGEALNEDNKLHLESGKSIPGYSLGKGAERRVVTDPLILLQKLAHDLGRKLTTAEVSDFLDIRIGKLENFWIQETKKSSIQFEDLLNGVIERKPNRGSIQRAAN